MPKKKNFLTTFSINSSEPPETVFKTIKSIQSSISPHPMFKYLTLLSSEEVEGDRQKLSSSDRSNSSGSGSYMVTLDVPNLPCSHASIANQLDRHKIGGRILKKSFSLTDLTNCKNEVQKNEHENFICSFPPAKEQMKKDSTLQNVKKELDKNLNIITSPFASVCHSLDTATYIKPMQDGMITRNESMVSNSVPIESRTSRRNSLFGALPNLDDKPSIIKLRSEAIASKIQGNIYEVFLISFMLLLIYILGGGLVFRHLEHEAEHNKCNYMTRELNQNYPRITDDLKHKFNGRTGVQFADFYELAHLFSEIQTHKATLVRKYKNDTIIITGTDENLRVEIMKILSLSGITGFIHFVEKIFLGRMAQKSGVFSHEFLRGVFLESMIF